MTHTTRISGPARYLVIGAALAGIFVSTAVADGAAPTARNGKLAYTMAVSALQIYAVTPDGSGTRRVAPSGSVDYEPVASPDGTRVAFVSSRDGNDEIYVANANGSGAVRLTRNRAYDYDPAWSPDSRRIAFASGRNGDSEIYVMNVDGASTTRLTGAPGEDENPAWSPDGTRIAFWSDRDDDADIYVMNSDGTNTLALTSNDDEDHFPAWSPDGARIAFTSDRDRQGDDEIFAMNADGGGVVQLTSTAGDTDDWWPTWSPDGARIAFISDRTEDDEIFVMNADGKAQRNVTNEEEFDDFSPSWTRNDRILFTSERAANLGIGTARADGSEPRVLAGSPHSEDDVTWSPNGAFVAFASDRDGDGEIFVTTATGRGLRQLTKDTRFDDFDPAWSPDGAKLAFSRADEFGGEFLYVMSADGSHQRFLLEGDDVCCADWSPDGRRIALSHDGDIVVVKADGSGRRLVSAAGDNTSPSWSPDGRSIVFDSDRDEDWDIFVVSALGGPPTLLTKNDVDDEWPDWSPDGLLIAFSQGDLDELEGSVYLMRADGTRVRRVPTASPAVDPSWQPLPERR